MSFARRTRSASSSRAACAVPWSRLCRRSCSTRRRSTTRPSRTLSAPMSVPIAVRRNTGATASWMTRVMSAMCVSKGFDRALPVPSVPDYRRLGGELLILRVRRQAAVVAHMAQHLDHQVETQRRQRAFPKFARGLALLDEAPVLRCDRPPVHALVEMIDRAAGDRIAFADGPLHRCDAAMPRQG